MIDPVLPRVLTTTGAQRLGFTAARIETELRRGRWQRLATGVLLTRPDRPLREDWVLAGLSLAGDDGALSGWDAVRLRGLGTSSPPCRHALVLTRRGKNRLVGGVRLRPSSREVSVSLISSRSKTLPGVPIASTARAIADTALDHAQFAPVRAMVTQAIQRGLCTAVELAAELAASPRNGSGHLRFAMQDILRGAESIAEAEAIELLRRPDIPPFEVNAEIHDGAGRLVAVADVLWRSLRAVLEVDSREFP